MVDEVSEYREPTDEIPHGLPLTEGQQAMQLVNKSLEILIDRLEQAADGDEKDLKA